MLNSITIYSSFWRLTANQCEKLFLRGIHPFIRTSYDVICSVTWLETSMCTSALQQQRTRQDPEQLCIRRQMKDEGVMDRTLYMSCLQHTLPSPTCSLLPCATTVKGQSRRPTLQILGGVHMWDIQCPPILNWWIYLVSQIFWEKKKKKSPMQT